MDGDKLLAILRNCNEGDCVVYDEEGGEVFKIKLEKKYPKNWKPN